MLWVPNWSSTAVTCGIVRRWVWGMIRLTRRRKMWMSPSAGDRRPSVNFAGRGAS
jgi:hypothetical protein